MPVVSPLLALMRDQIAAASRAGLRAATINCTNVGEWSGVLDDLRSGSLDVLLNPPERPANPGFAAQLPALLSHCGVLVIDEAHCVSDRGFEFQPDDQHCLLTPDASPRASPQWRRRNRRWKLPRQVHLGAMRTSD